MEGPRNRPLSDLQLAEYPEHRAFILLSDKSLFPALRCSLARFCDWSYGTSHCLSCLESDRRNLGSTWSYTRFLKQCWNSLQFVCGSELVWGMSHCKGFQACIPSRNSDLCRALPKSLPIHTDLLINCKGQGSVLSQMAGVLLLDSFNQHH